jgi:hypothetical protein
MFLVTQPLKVVRNPSLGAVLSDIESHMPDGHQYKSSDLVNYAHECTHALNARLRDRKPGKNAFYCLENKYILLDEPNTTVRAIAAKIPKELRQSDTYDLYLIKQAASWNDRPLYIMDEFSSYLNGAACAMDLVTHNLWKDGRRPQTIMNALEFMVYNAVLAAEDGSDAVDEFIQYQAARAISYHEQSRPTIFFDPAADDYLSLFKKSKYAPLVDVELKDYGTSLYV